MPDCNICFYGATVPEPTPIPPNETKGFASMTTKQRQEMEGRKKRRLERQIRHKAQVLARKERASRRRARRMEALERFLADPAKETARIRRELNRRARRVRLDWSHRQDIQRAGRGQLPLL
jgi:exonuclease VII large subunit